MSSHENPLTIYGYALIGGPPLAFVAGAWLFALRAAPWSPGMFLVIYGVLFSGLALLAAQIYAQEVLMFASFTGLFGFAACGFATVYWRATNNRLGSDFEASEQLGWEYWFIGVPMVISLTMGLVAWNRYKLWR